MSVVKRDQHEFTVADRLYGAWDNLQFSFMNLDRLEATWNETQDGLPFPADLRHIVELARCLNTLIESARIEYIDRVEV